MLDSQWQNYGEHVGAEVERDISVEPSCPKGPLKIVILKPEKFKLQWGLSTDGGNGRTIHYEIETYNDFIKKYVLVGKTKDTSIELDKYLIETRLRVVAVNSHGRSTTLEQKCPYTQRYYFLLP